MKIGYELHKIAFSTRGKLDMDRWVGQKMDKKIGFPLWMAPIRKIENTYITIMKQIKPLSAVDPIFETFKG